MLYLGQTERDLTKEPLLVHDKVNSGEAGLYLGLTHFGQSKQSYLTKASNA